MHNITNSRKHKMALSVVWAMGLITVMTMVGAAIVQTKATEQPLIELVLTQQVDRDCIPNYADCMDMEQVHKPCCRQQQLEVGQVLPEDFICFRFGEGTCQPLSSVAKLDKYAELVKFANENNVVDMIEQYREDEVLEEKTTVSGLDAIPIERDDGLTKPDDVTTEPDAVLIERDDVPIERDDGLPKPDDVTTEPDAVLIERDDVLMERDDVITEPDAVEIASVMIF